MQYVSTRSGNSTAQFSDILLAGLAPDGGLFVPTEYPKISSTDIANWRTLLATEGYAALAAAVLGLFADDIPTNELRGICERAYNSEVFASSEIVPVSRLSDGIYLAHLSDGPTAAFKDMAMQFLGQLFEYELARRNTTLNILGATSGDTGSSAEYAMRARKGIRVFMLTPAGRMTPFQQAQMYSLQDPEIINIAITGVFDDCQDLVKAISSDLDFKERHLIGAVNSINWARVSAQIVYYIASYLRVTLTDDEQVSFSVPTGNFGNILAGHVARQMGLPIAELILATNENNVLDEFFHTGVYRVRGGADVFATSSPSMDISKASNFERFIYDLFDGDSTKVADLFGRQLGENGFFDISNTSEFAHIRERFGFISGSSTHTDRLATIASVWESDGKMIDPHTADGVTVARRLRPDTKVIVTETALPVKFAATIKEAIGITPPRPTRFEGIEDLPRVFVELPNDEAALRQLIEDRT